jgi:signal transduction histidine kinase
MKPLRYLRDKAIGLTIALAALAAIALVLYVFNLDGMQIVFTCSLLVIALVGALVLDFLRRRRFYDTLTKTLEQLDKRYLISELIDSPDFLEGELTYQALAYAGKDMNDKIASYRIASEEYREFIETWIHEIKTPIAAAQLIVENNRNKTSADLTYELDQIEAFVEQALYYSRSATLEKDYSIREQQLEDLVKAALRKQARVLIASKISPQLEGLEVTVYTDAKWFVFILGQIISNAIKYQKPDVPESTLYFSAEPAQGASVVLHIRDQGVGIPSEDLERVFDKGFTGSNGRNFGRSTGLGLYLCKKLCSKMGLAISLSSEQGVGTSVSIVLPQDKLYFVD